ncbi:hypothetical protein AB0300_16555 [Microbacterium sp. NPDC078814]|uniref:hypothetical protein n=1 Tax=Microbacterium sp. NPDC078814 TaxID=3154767 RepID=UPI00344E7A0B
MRADEWFADMRAVHHCTRSTVRGSRVAVRGFCSFALDPAYGWAEDCMHRFGTHPAQIITYPIAGWIGAASLALAALVLTVIAMFAGGAAITFAAARRLRTSSDAPAPALIRE